MTILIVSAWLFTCCGVVHPLTQSELDKLDARLQLLVTSKETRDDQQFVVLIRSMNPDELRSEGVQVKDVAGEIVIAEVTIPQLKRIVALRSVQSVDSNSRRSPQ